MALSGLGLVALAYGIIEAGRDGWAEPAVLVPLAAGAALLAAFVAWQRRATHPLIDLTMFSDVRLFTWATIAAALANFGLFGVLFVLPQYLQIVRGYGPLETGLALFPLILGLTGGAGLSNRLTASIGAKPTIVAGFAVAAAGLAWHATVDISSGYGLVAAAQVVAGAGMGIAVVPAVDAMMSVLPPDRTGTGTGLNQTVRQIGSALGVALLGSVLSGAYTNHLDPAVSGLPSAARETAGESVAAAVRLADRMPAPRGPALHDAAQRAFIHAMDVVLLACAGAAIAAAVLVACFLTARPR